MAGNNAINNNAISFLGPSYIGVNYVNAYQNITSGSNTVMYTCPDGKRAYATSVMVHNPTAGPVSGTFYIRVSGVDYQIGPARSIAAEASIGGSAASSSGGWWETSIILEANESLVFNGNGLNVFMTILEYANNVPVFTSKIIDSANANNTIYTVPANKISLIGIQASVRNGVFWYNTGAAATANCYFVDSGGAAGATNAVGSGTGTGPSMLASSGLTNNIHGVAVLSAGDFVQVNLNGVRNGIIWANVWETDV